MWRRLFRVYVRISGWFEEDCLPDNGLGFWQTVKIGVVLTLGFVVMMVLIVIVTGGRHCILSGTCEEEAKLNWERLELIEKMKAEAGRGAARSYDLPIPPHAPQATHPPAR